MYAAVTSMLGHPTSELIIILQTYQQARANWHLYFSITDLGTINDFRKRLLDFCVCFDLLILNGFKHGDEKENFTYVSTHGYSVIDYCLVSDSFVDRVAKFAVSDRVESLYCSK